MEDKEQKEEEKQNLITYDENDDIAPFALSGDQNADADNLRSSFIDSSVKANFMLTVMTIMKSVVGSGLLSLPYTVSQLGWIFSFFAFLLVILINHFTAILLLKSKNLSHHSNYSTIFYSIKKSRLTKGCGSMVIFLNNLGACIIYLTVLKKTVRKILEDILQPNSVLNQFYTQEWFLIILVVIIETPLTFLNKIERLRFCAFVGFSGIATFLISFLAHYVSQVQSGAKLHEMQSFPRNWYLVASSIPNLIISFNFQMNFFPIFKGMRNASDKKMALASITGLGSCAVVYLFVGIMGFSLYGDNKLDENFLANIPYGASNKLLYYLMNFSFLIAIVNSFPLLFFGARNNFISLVNIMRSSKNRNRKNLSKLYIDSKNPREDALVQEEDLDEQELQPQRVKSRQQKKKRERREFIILTFILLIIQTAITIAVQDVGALFNVVGALCSAGNAIFLPCIFYFLLARSKKAINWKYYMAIIVFCTMVPYCIFSIVARYI